ncbi:MAG: ABC transporter substrate-binding protein [Gordonia sp. (in: high G+C Gram-positive bacteria)]
MLIHVPDASPTPALDTLWFTRCPVPTATGIAADLNWLTEEFSPDAIAVRTLQDAGQDVPRASHFTHDLTGLFREGGNVPALWARASGERTRLIGLTWIEERQAIAVRPGSIIDGPHALAGKRIAVPRRPIAIDFWRAMALAGFAGALGEADATLADVIHVDVDAAANAPQWDAELRALTEEKVDAVYLKGALSVEAAARHGAVIGIDLDALPTRRARVNNGTPRPVTVHQQLLDDHPDLVIRFLRVLTEAASWASTNPPELAHILATETGAGRHGVDGAYRWLHNADLRVDLSAERLELLDHQAKFLHQQGFLPQTVDVIDWHDPAPLATAQAAANPHRTFSNLDWRPQK